MALLPVSVRRLLVKSRRLLNSTYAGIPFETKNTKQARDAHAKLVQHQAAAQIKADRRRNARAAIEKRLELFPRRSRALAEYLLRDASFDRRFLQLAIHLMRSTKPGQPIRKITSNPKWDRQLLDNAWAMDNLPNMLMQLELAHEDPRVSKPKRDRLSRMRAKYHEKFAHFMRINRAILVMYLESPEAKTLLANLRRKSNRPGPPNRT